MVPSIALWASAIVYQIFIGIIGLATGLLISLLFRRRPSERDILADFVLAIAVGLAVVALFTVYQELRGISTSGGPSLIPFAIGAVAVRHFLGSYRRRRE
jgi:hypothetical protein